MKYIYISLNLHKSKDIYKYDKLTDHIQEQPEGSLFNYYNTEV